MSTHPHTGAPRASRRLVPDNTRWTGEKASTFLKTLARCGKVAAAAQAVGMSRQAAYRLRARAPKFAEFWDMAMEQAEAVRASAGKGQGRRKPVHPLLARQATPPAAAPAPAAARQGGEPGDTYGAAQ